MQKNKLLITKFKQIFNQKKKLILKHKKQQYKNFFFKYNNNFFNGINTKLISINQLVNLNAFLGDNKKNWNLLLSNFYLGVRYGHIIINLEITLFYIKIALAFLIQNYQNNPRFLLFFVNNTSYVDEYFKYFKFFRFGFYNASWVGGTINNYKKIWIFLYKNLSYLQKTNMRKQFILSILNRRQKVWNNTNFYKFKRLPDVLVCLKTDSYAIKESLDSKIPTIGFNDGGALLQKIDYPIIINDDSQYGSLIYTKIFIYASLVGKLFFFKKFFKFYFNNNLSTIVLLTQLKAVLKNLKKS